jgi:uncharacterized protein
MINTGLFISQTVTKGKGVFTTKRFRRGLVIEESPVIVMSSDDRIHLDRTLLHDYIFEWGEKRDQCCMALGFISMYNHDYNSNCEYFMNFTKELIRIKTIREINAGEELTINYNGDWNDPKKVWFEVS